MGREHPSQLKTNILPENKILTFLFLVKGNVMLLFINQISDVTECIAGVVAQFIIENLKT
jgi:hypothetical protein